MFICTNSHHTTSWEDVGAVADELCLHTSRKLPYKTKTYCNSTAHSKETEIHNEINSPMKFRRTHRTQKIRSFF